MILAVILAITASILLIGGISKRIRETIFTIPLLCMLFGLLVALASPSTVAPLADLPLVEIIVTLTLALLLATDASRISLNTIFRSHNLPMRLLLIGLPLTMALGAIMANAMFGALLFWEAAILAVSLAPTDTSPAENSVENPRVPARIRLALDIEGGLNDGITMPFLLMTVSLAVAVEGGIGRGQVVIFGILEIVLGVLVGAVIGYLGTKYIFWGRRSGWMSSHFQKIVWLALIVMAYGIAELIAGNGLIASFVFGVTSGNTMGRLEGHQLREFTKVENSILMIMAFVLFGMIMLPGALKNITPKVLLFSLLSLTLVRMLPVAISLIGTKLLTMSKLYIGWFGPRGIAAILYVLIVIKIDAIAGRSTIADVAIITVAISLILHGITAWPLSEWYGKRIMRLSRKGDAETEMIAVPELPTRAGWRQQGDNATLNDA